MDRGTWCATVHGVTESDMTEHMTHLPHTHTHILENVKIKTHIYIIKCKSTHIYIIKYKNKDTHMYYKMQK